LIQGKSLENIMFSICIVRGKEKIWKLYKTSDKIFLFSGKNLLLFLNNFYKFHAQNEWENVRQKIPPELGLWYNFYINCC
jgi:hypothetical protein